MQNDFIDLGKMQPIVEGKQQVVFQHPDHEHRIIKVRRHSRKSHQFRRPASRRLRSFRLWHLELTEYLTAIAQQGHHFDRMPRHFGFMDTSLGPAIVVEKITGQNGRIAPTLETVLETLDDDHATFDALLRDAHALFDDIFRLGLEWKDIGQRNLVVASRPEPHLVVIDGMGKSPLIPLPLLSKWIYARVHAQDKKRLISSMMRFAPHT